MNTLTILEQRNIVNENRLKSQEAYEAWRLACARRDEVTDQAERLAAPMENSFDYDLAPEGLVTDLGEPILPVLQEGYDVAVHQAQFDPRWEFEVSQRAIEVEEQHEFEALARATGSGVRITSLSLDKSDYQGMRAIAQAIGHELPVERPASTDILQNRLWIGTPPGAVVLSPIPDAVRNEGIDIGAYDKNRQKMIVRVVTLHADGHDEHKNLVERIRTAYDDSLSEQFGGNWFAGRQGISVQDAKLFIEQQPDLIDAHMQIVDQVHRTTPNKQERLRLLAPHRYNLAAALDDRLQGRQVTSLTEAGATARAKGRTFDGDCPTTDRQATTASQQAEALGYTPFRAKEELKCVSCPFCTPKTGKTVDAIKNNITKTIECKSCPAKVDLRTGKRIDSQARAAAQKIGAATVRTAAKAVPKPRPGDVAQQHGQKMRLERRITVGDAKLEYMNIKTGERTPA